LLAAAIASSGGCSPAIPMVDPEAPAFRSQPLTELARLARGREEYIAKCSGCHSLYRPSRGTSVNWSSWVSAMADRSKVCSEERERILAYLSAACCPSDADSGIARP